MMTRRTIYLLLLTALLGTGLAAWSLGARDVCSAHRAGLPGPPTQVISLGPQQVEVPCELWFPRQPPAAQAVCLCAVVLGVCTLAGFGMDLVQGFRARRLRRRRA